MTALDHSRDADPAPPLTQTERLATITAWVRDAVDDAFLRADTASDRNWQVEPGLSQSGGCERQAGYAAQGVEWSDAPPAGREAVIGGWIHEKFLPLLAEALGGGAVIEQEVRLDGVLGHLDLATGPIVLDAKTKYEGGTSKPRTYGPKRRELWQVTGYAEARRRLGYDIEYVGLVYIDRSRGETYVWVAPFDPSIVEEMLSWWHGVKNAPDPDKLPRGYRGPGLSPECDGCTWLTRCWGEAAQRVLLDEAPIRDEAIEQALEGHRLAADRESDARKEKEFFAAMLDGEPEATYGEWELYFGRTGRRLREKEAKGLLLELGVDPPLGASSTYVRSRKVSGDPS